MNIVLSKYFRELDNSEVDNTTTLVWKHKGIVLYIH